MNKINVGILGNGFIGSMHCEELGKIDGFKVVSVADTNTKTFGSLDSKVKTYMDYRELLKQHPDAIIVALPDKLHLPAIESIAEFSPKSIILLEKPLSTNLENSLKLAEIVEKEKIRTMIGLTGHYHPEFSSAYENLEKIGKIQGLDEKIHLGAENFPAENYLPINGRGIVLENGVHTFDRFILFGHSGINIDSIVLTHIGDDNFKRNCDDNAAGSLTMKNLIPATFSFAWYNYNHEDYIFTVNGEDGQIQVRGFKYSELISKTGKSKILFQHDLSLSLRDRHRPGINAELRDFKKFIKGGSSPYLFSYALEAQKTIEKIYSIAGSNK